MPSFAQFHVNEVARVAREAWTHYMRGGDSVWVYYRPMRLGVFSEKPEGWTLAYGERVPSHLTVEQLSRWVATFADKTPYLTE